METRKIDNLLLNVSTFLVLCVALIRPYLTTIFKLDSITVVFLSVAIFLTLIILCSRNKIKFNKNYIILCILYLIPFFYNNAYVQDKIWTRFFSYLFTIIYFILYYLCLPKEKNINMVLKLIISFSIITSIVTWIGFLFPDIYVKKIVTLLPSNDIVDVLKSFPNVNPGLTNHYSRNAFFIVIGIMASMFFYLKNKQKKDLFLISFLVLSLFLVGKRGHLLFLIISFILTYIIYNKIGVKTCIKLLLLGLVVVSLSIFAIKYIPGANTTYERILRKSTSDDISTGRFEMYEDIYEMYKQNNYTPIGWSQYASSTSYHHPGVHNDYIQLFCETGIIGTIIIVGINLIMLIRSINFSRKDSSKFYFLAIIYNIFFMTYSLTGIPHYDVELYIMYFFVNTVMYLLSNKYLSNLKGE